MKAGASRRIRTIEAILRERGVEFEPAGLERAARRPAPARSTEELLAAREELVRARAEADTGGARQGLSRRIRGIERELAARGVDFQPAALERPPRRPPATEASTEELLNERAELIQAREAADTRGARQRATRRIHSIERELAARGVEFEPADVERAPRRPAPEELTTEELRAEHAALIDRYRSADTAGVKAGASRRIRPIETALRQRGVEFEPAALERLPRGSSPTARTSEDLLAGRDELIDRYRSAETAGVKAGASRRIRTIEAILRERGVEFEPAGLERAARRPAPARSTEELLAAREELVRARAEADTGGARQGLSRRIRGIERELAARGVDFQPAALERPPRRPPATEASTEELLNERAELIQAREAADTRGARQRATRRIHSIERELGKRGIRLEGAVAHDHDPGSRPPQVEPLRGSEASRTMNVPDVQPRPSQRPRRSDSLLSNLRDAASKQLADALSRRRQRKG